jgi:hypothetical protein
LLLLLLPINALALFLSLSLKDTSIASLSIDIMFRPSKRSRFVGTGGFGEAQLLPPSTTTAMMMNNSIANNFPTSAACCWLDASFLGPVPSHFHQQQQQEEQPFIHTPLATAVTKDIFLERLQKEIIDRFVFSLSSSRNSSSGTCCSRLSPDESFADARHRHMLLKKRIVVGFNACTKALQSSCYYNTSKQQQHNNGSSSTDCLAQQMPSLVVVALDDSEMELKMSPTAAGAAMLLAHIPLLAHQAGVPLLILPGPNASQCLNRLLMRHHNSANGGSSSSNGSGQQVTSTAFTIYDTSSSFDPNHRIPRVTVMAFLPRQANEFTSPAGQVIHGAVDSLVDFFISKAAGTTTTTTTTTTITKNATAAAASCFASEQQQQQQPCTVSNKMIY